MVNNLLGSPLLRHLPEPLVEEGPGLSALLCPLASCLVFLFCRPEQTLDYRTLSALMSVPFLTAEKSKALGALDGEVADYATTDLTSPDCRYSQFTLAPVEKVTSDQIELNQEPVKQPNPISRFLTNLVAGQ